MGDKDDKILVYGNNVKIYYLTDRFAFDKYAYQNPIFYVDESLIDDFINDFNREKPKMIIAPKLVQKDRYTQFLKTSIEKYYDEVATTKQGIIYKLK